MPEIEFSAFPFISRKMLAFEGGVIFDLEVVTASRLATAIEVTGMTREGPFRYDLVTNTTGLALTTIFRMPDLPIFLTVKTAGVAASINDVYAMVYVRANQTRLQLLCQGFLGQFHGINFPNQVPMTELQRLGAPGDHTSADPAAGAEATLTIPAGEYWLVKAVKATLVTGADAGSRSVALAYRGPDAQIIRSLSVAVQPASKTVIYYWWEGAVMKEDTVGGFQQMPLISGILLRPTTEIYTSTQGIFDADNWGTLRVYYQRFYAA